MWSSVSGWRDEVFALAARLRAVLHRRVLFVALPQVGLDVLVCISAISIVHVVVNRRARCERLWAVGEGRMTSRLGDGEYWRQRGYALVMRLGTPVERMEAQSRLAEVREIQKITAQWMAAQLRKAA